MHVPLLDLRRQWQLVGPSVLEAVERVLAGGAYILGEDVAALERELATRLALPHAIGVSSGSDALLVSLMALGIGPGDEVVTTALSFFATAGAIARLGARPVFADIDPRTFNLDPKSALARVTPRTRAIVPVHLFGAPAELAPLAQSGLPIVEDAAQALDAAGVGRAGALTTLSFFPSKNLGAAGDAGMVLTSDDALADRVRLLRAHGSRPKYIHGQLGGNFRLDTLQAAILRAKLPHLAEWNRRRRENAARYRALLDGTPLTLPADTPGHVWHHFVVRAPRRDELRAHLLARGVESEIYYPRPLHLQPCFASLGGREGELPEAERACREVLALPIHAELAEEQLVHVAASVKEFYRG
ncbi:MAG TPA: DegT/DnrJ/EryC1/StrS family aminotransferase [Polyangia bacterium]